MQRFVTFTTEHNDTYMKLFLFQKQILHIRSRSVADNNIQHNLEVENKLQFLVGRKDNLWRKAVSNIYASKHILQICK